MFSRSVAARRNSGPNRLVVTKLCNLKKIYFIEIFYQKKTKNELIASFSVGPPHSATSSIER